MAVYSLYILNKAGGLIYQSDNDRHPGVNKLTANDYLVLAGTLHGVHAITSRFTTSMIHSHDPNTTNIPASRLSGPNTNKSGLQSIETDHFNLYVFQTLTGIKFIVVTSPIPTTNLGRGELNVQLELANQLFKDLYVLYSDYVMKDPFYSIDMPIKNPHFDSKIKQLIN
ncbi:hypothetical protein PSN45_000298 [Yamadazyma tenuis]|uniref:Trafficking protein particle complex subunit n=1 Tax=Candida tenuis (strain ATCC 10573 / BCRC 21748 / CBS 615 / JCM 9827 / NBRC 10315 / NRRL Y-1498 / VKM Y-70) TaxID=590646 RepID=G3B7C0_CANTC|nr:uncharacterized protein CANTEDRAFT_107239 [Yamadazyma tenuis ATCC 10573]EGV61620.1 hypothetical protein CANTEDRAFT_107239 [Yamadazyma tenuis ATCC 10573]WEJ92840.1 hypothetical protein PSN45_000298 [Yamadazyma tenuis]